MTIGAKSLVSSALLTRGFGQGPDFDIYTRAATADTASERPIIRMVGSSTVKDLQGDTMTITALEDMTRCDPHLTVFIDHTYDLPDSVYGSLAEQPAIKMQNGIADLHLAVETDLSRPVSKARDIYTQINKGKIRLGCSIGCQVLDYTLDGDPDDWFAPITINRVYTVEFSIVGIPANQRSWVEQAIKGLFERSLVEGRDEDVRRLAPAMKSLWNGPYDTILREIESDGLRRDLSRVRTRSAGPQRIMFDFVQNGFVLAGPKNVKKSLAIDEVDALLSQPPDSPDKTDIVEDKDVDTTKAASGKTSWPLMSIGTEWTGSKAEKQIFDWARNDQDEIVASKARQCFLYYNPDESDKQSGYKMPFCYIADGSPKIVPLGVRACANVLSGGRGGGDFGGDDGAMKAKVKTMYGRINSEFHPDPEWEVPWDKSEKDVEPDVQKEIADSESDAALNRQDLGEMTIKEDGSHEPFTGTHTHRHTDKQGGIHEHEHTHNGDADHGHDHMEHKTASADACGCCSECTGASDCTCCDKCMAQKSATAEVTHAHEHTQVGSHVDSVKSIQPTPEQMALLNVYNSIGKQLGFPEHALTTKCDLVANDSDVTVVRTMLASLDDVSDAMIDMSKRNEFYVDSLMRLLGVPDVNDVAAGDEGENTGMMLMRSQQSALTKDGSTLSSDHRTHLQVIHDMVCAMHPDACKGMSGDGTSHQDGTVSVEEAQEQARQMGQGDSYSNLSSLMAETTKTVLLKAFETVDAKSLVEASVQKAVDVAVSSARANLEQLQREQTALMQHISKLANMPLGRPTNLQRSVTPASSYALDNVASYEEILGVTGIEAPKQHSLSELEAMTQIVSKSLYTANGEVATKMRYWPAEVGKGYRPPLTANQKVLMHSSDWEKYREASGDVFVPVVDDPFMEG